MSPLEKLIIEDWESLKIYAREVSAAMAELRDLREENGMLRRQLYLARQGGEGQGQPSQSQ